MKKSLLLVAAAAAMTLAACSDKNAGSSDIISADMSDSICATFGQMAGTQLGHQFEMALKQDSTLSKDEFIRGMVYALAGDTATSYAYGMNIGMNIQRQFKDFESRGIKVDKKLLVAEFIKAFKADSFDNTAANMLQAQYQALMGQASSLKKAYDDSIKANAPEALANIKAGETYVDSLKSIDPEVKTTASGLSYKIVEPGDTAQMVGKGDRVVINYRGSLTDGKVFDQSMDGAARPHPVTGYIEGMTEGLQLLGKGGKAVLYIPGKIAYGPDGNPRAGIGPMQTLVFEVEVVDINPSLAAPSNPAVSR